uniref:ABC transmembrane type-2 domain-containing protein n=1 Tax=Strigamia maritima TaxID=126957 RepID=T1JN53_STRMM
MYFGDILRFGIMWEKKRRVSFAIALLHEPPLLILDEPTVGVDPILRENIWNHLFEVCHRERVTVIITTHYIEESRQANKVSRKLVGFMRNGRILIEDSPDVLLRRYNLPTLENVYHKLCEQDNLKENEIQSNDLKSILSIQNSSYAQVNEQIRDANELVTAVNDPVTAVNDPVTAVTKQIQKTGLPQSIGRIFGLVIKNVHQIRRNPILLFLQFVIPTVQVIAIFLAIGSNPRNVPIAVFNEDTYMGLQYLKHVNNQTITQVTVDSVESGTDLVINGKAFAVIHIWKNFTDALMDRFIARGNVTQNLIRASSVHLRQDTTNQLVMLFINHALMQAYVDFSKQELGNVKKYPQLVHFLLEAGDPIYSNAKDKLNGRDFIGSTLLLAILYINAIGIASLPLIVEKKDGLHDRNVISGVTSLEIICSYILTQFGFAVIQASIVLIFAYELFHMSKSGSVILVVILLLLQGMCGMSLGFLISTICDGASTAIMLSTLLIFPGIAMSGILWTILGMPDFLKNISVGFPHTLAVESMRWITLRGRDMLWINVWPGFAATIVLTLAFIIVSVIVLQLRQP